MSPRVYQSVPAATGDKDDERRSRAAPLRYAGTFLGNIGMTQPGLRWIFVLAAILSGFAALMVTLYSPVLPYSDADGLAYLYTAKALALHSDPAQRLSDPFEFVGEQMVEAPTGAFYSKYAIGYSLLAAIAYKVGGATAPFLVNPLSRS